MAKTDKTTKNFVKKDEIVENLSKKSIPIKDPSLQRLYDWVQANGGIFQCESRADADTNVRGLYATKDFKDPNDPIIQIPSKLIVSPYHISRRLIAADGGTLTYGDLFSQTPSLFHPKYPFEPHSELPHMLENQLGEYFQLSLFLIIERLKGEKSFYKPFLDYLPARNDTLYTLSDNTPVTQAVNAGQTTPMSLLSEVQNPNDDMHRWIKYDRDIDRKAKMRF